MTTYRNWRIYNKLLEDRGRITVFFDGISSLDIVRLNKNKKGRPFEYGNPLIFAVFAVKCVFKFGYRQARGLVVDLKDKLGLTSVPNFRTLQWRISKMKESVKFNILENRKGIIVAIDSTGLKRSNDGEYRTMMYDKRKDWIKLHISVDIKTGKILTAKVTNSNSHDIGQIKNLLDPLSNVVSKVLADKGYDSEKSFRFCNKNNVIAGIPVRKNASLKCRGYRRNAVAEQLGIRRKPGRPSVLDMQTEKRHRKIVQDRWKKKIGYGYRWRVEGTFGNYKRMFGEYVFSRKTLNIQNEILTKINIYNQFIG